MEWIIAVLVTAIIGVLVALLWAQRNEILYLRGRLGEKHDHEHRIERTEAGLPELKVDPPHDDTPPPALAAEIEELLGQWESAATQEQLRQDIQAWRRDGQEWDWILDRMRDEVLG